MNIPQRDALAATHSQCCRHAGNLGKRDNTRSKREGRMHREIITREDWASQIAHLRTLVCL
ncbi:hypothetical protein OAE21_00860 [Rubripirellula sp.]|nr:hypothetical protein [Rubripirellula sp.]